MAALAIGACNDHRSKVPADAKPAEFKRLKSWELCGATGQYCSESILFGSKTVSYEAASSTIASRYREKGWDADVRDTHRVSLTSPNGRNCIWLERFDVDRYVQGLGAPAAEELADVAEPYATRIVVVAFSCP